MEEINYFLKISLSIFPVMISWVLSLLGWIVVAVSYFILFS